jgi:hypothetical protein
MWIWSYVDNSLLDSVFMKKQTSECISEDILLVSYSQSYHSVRHSKELPVAQEVSHWSLTVGVRVCTQVNPCEICSGQSDTGTGFSPEFLGFPLSNVISRRLSILINNLGMNKRFIDGRSSETSRPIDMNRTRHCLKHRGKGCQRNSLHGRAVILHNNALFFLWISTFQN